MRVLVTGGGGYLGSVLINLLLNNGHTVRVIDNLFRKSDNLICRCANPNFEYIYGDVIDPNHVKKAYQDVDAVVHLAALVGEPICAKQPELATLTNVEGTYNICKYKPNDIPLIFASTGSVYGKVEGVCTEESPLNALSHYAKTKIEGERLVRRTPNSVVYRFSTAFGVSDNMRVDLLVNDLVYKAKHERSLVIFQSNFRRSFVHCRDIADAVYFGLNNYTKMSYETFNVGYDLGNWTKRQLAEYLEKNMGCAVFYADKGYTDTDQRDYEISFEKMKKLGWEAKVTMETGINELVRASELIKITHQYM